MRHLFLSVLALAFALGCGTAGNAWGHAFPDHQTPQAGATLATAPQQVAIWFDDALAPTVSTILITDANGHVIAKGTVAAGKDRSTNLLQVQLPPLAPGTYRVHWSVVDRDGHHTEGQYSFTIKPHAGR